MRREKWSSILVLLLSVAFALALAEGVLRGFYAASFALPEDERSLAYRYDAELGWFPLPGGERTIAGTRTFRVRHNARGFRGPPLGSKTRPRIAVLGDSFVWGFDVEAGERFTERLAERLPGFEVLNLGVSGYGTDQELLLFRREVASLEPDIVLLVFAKENDREDNTTNRRYGPYYKPYFEIEGGRLALRGEPVPRPLPYLRERFPALAASLLARAVYTGWLTVRHPVRTVPDPSHALVLAVRDAAREAGARFALGVQGRDEPLLAFAQQERIPAVPLVTRQRYPHFGGHWTPEGHAFVAEQLYQLLATRGLLDAAHAPP